MAFPRLYRPYYQCQHSTIRFPRLYDPLENNCHIAEATVSSHRAARTGRETGQYHEGYRTAGKEIPSRWNKLLVRTDLTLWTCIGALVDTQADPNGVYGRAVVADHVLPRAQLQQPREEARRVREAREPEHLAGFAVRVFNGTLLE